MVLRPEDFPDFEEEPFDYVPAPDELDLTAHLLVPKSEGVGNAPLILHAYMLNRFEHVSPDFDVRQYQRQLREYKVGQFITIAIDSIYEKDRADTIDPALQTGMRKNGNPETIAAHHALIDEAAPYLPPGVSPDVFIDPPYDDLEAA